MPLYLLHLDLWTINILWTNSYRSAAGSISVQRHWCTRSGLDLFKRHIRSHLRPRILRSLEQTTLNSHGVTSRAKKQENLWLQLETWHNVPLPSYWTEPAYGSTGIQKWVSTEYFHFAKKWNPLHNKARRGHNYIWKLGQRETERQEETPLFIDWYYWLLLQNVEKKRKTEKNTKKNTKSPFDYRLKHFIFSGQYICFTVYSVV